MAEIEGLNHSGLSVPNVREGEDFYERILGAEHCNRISVSTADVRHGRSVPHTCNVLGDYLFVHAGVRPGIPLDRQSATDMLWIRDDFLRSKVPLPGWIVVHGHTICDLPQNRKHRINIDTGAFVSGRLTCLVLRAARRQFMSTLDV